MQKAKRWMEREEVSRCQACKALVAVLLSVFFQVGFLPMLHGFMLEAAFGAHQVNCLNF